MSSMVDAFMAQVEAKNAAQPEFHQAVQEVVETVVPVVERNPAYKQMKILERLVEPERVLMFRVPWVDDKGTDLGMGGQTMGEIIPSLVSIAPAVQSPLIQLRAVHPHQQRALSAKSNVYVCLMLFVGHLKTPG